MRSHCRLAGQTEVILRTTQQIGLRGSGNYRGESSKGRWGWDGEPMSKGEKVLLIQNSGQRDGGTFWGNTTRDVDPTTGLTSEGVPPDCPQNWWHCVNISVGGSKSFRVDSPDGS